MTTLTRRTNILLVEDNQAHADLIALSLGENDDDVSITHVADGARAVEFLEDHRDDEPETQPDVVLLDINLPKLSGHKVLERIKSDDALKKIPVVMLTTSDNEQDKAMAYELHANSYLTKPANFEEFQSLIHDLQKYWTAWNRKPV